MKKKNIILCSVIAILVIAGAIFFATQNKNEIAKQVSVSYSNGTDSVKASFDNKKGTVTFTHPSLGTVTLPQAISGSGARYANQDETIVFWEHQGEATITKNGAEVFKGLLVPVSPSTGPGKDHS